jgi:uncharacterized membrane protein
MIKRKLPFLLLGTIALFSGCFYDKEELLYPSPPCISTGSTYSSTVSPIITANCVACHGAQVANTNGAGIVLDSYNSIKPYATNGKLVGAINHASGYYPMPKNSAKLTSCDIAKITDWVNNGALNN